MLHRAHHPLTLLNDGLQCSNLRCNVRPVCLRSSDLVVADFGCGEAKLALEVENKVHSFDLIALNDRVTVCDISEVRGHVTPGVFTLVC